MGKWANPWERQNRILQLSEYRRRQRFRLLTRIGLASLLVFAGGMLLTVGRPLIERASSATGSLSLPFVESARFTCTVAHVTDGDTFRCRQTDDEGRPIRVRLSGVAAREIDGTCSPGHPCPAASAQAATAHLTGLAMGWTLSCKKVGNSYDRVAAFCRRADGVDLSCAMVASGTAAKWWRYWRFHRCPAGSVPVA